MTSNQTHQVVQHGAIGKLVKNFTGLIYMWPHMFVKKSELSFMFDIISGSTMPCLFNNCNISGGEIKVYIGRDSVSATQGQALTGHTEDS